MFPDFKLCSICRRQVSNVSNSNCDACNLENDNDDNIPHDDVINDVNYILPKDYNNLMNNICQENNKYLSMVHFNCRSIKRNLDNFRSVLASISCPFSCIALSETWLTSSESIHIPGYTFIGNGRVSKRGGGVGCLIRNDVRYKQRKDLEVFNQCIETVFIELYSKLHNIIIAIVYRPPGQNINDFLSSLETSLSAISREKKQCFLIGDFNIDLLTSTPNQYVNNFTDLLTSFACTPLILNPTRITQGSATLIDNIFTNNTNNVLRTGILVNDVSDHLSVFAIVNHEKNTFSQPKRFKRFINDDSVNQFNGLLQSFDWNDMNSSNDTEDKYDIFIKKVTTAYNQCFPVKEVLHKVSDVNPWFTNDLKKMCKKKNMLYRKYIKNPTDYRKLVYTQCRNKVSSAIRHHKQQYYQNRFSKVRNDIKGTWRAINDVLTT